MLAQHKRLIPRIKEVQKPCCKNSGFLKIEMLLLTMKGKQNDKIISKSSA
jgi:hypothetical protein